MKKYLYGFIGCGNMGGTLARAIAKKVGGNSVAVCDYDTQKTESLKKDYGVCVENLIELAKNSKFVVLGVKPQVIKSVCNELATAVENSSETVIISMAAGVDIATIQSYLGEKFIGGIIRIMPNTPCILGEGMVLYSTMGASNDDKEQFIADFSVTGLLDEIDEKDMDAAGALSGCGPAFVYYFAESLIDGVVACGIQEDKAKAYAIQTLLGAAKMLCGEESPRELREKVCSPNGTTLAGLSVLEKGDFKKLIASTVDASYRRSLELKKQD